MGENLGAGGTPKPRSRRMAYSDRYIPSRAGTNIHANFTLLQEHRNSDTRIYEEADVRQPDGEPSYNFLLKNKLFGDTQQTSPNTGSKQLSQRSSWSGDSESSAKVFKFQADSKGSPQSKDLEATLRVEAPAPKAKRRISKSPYKVLCAPNLQDDFYLNLVDWSSQNMLAVGLGDDVYVWSPCTSGAIPLPEPPARWQPGRVTSVAWSPNGQTLAVGSESGTVFTYDGTTLQKKESLNVIPRGNLPPSLDSGRIGCLAWSSTRLAYGSRKGKIGSVDLRQPAPYWTHDVEHDQEVCGLKWSPDETQLASGGNDNRLLVWSAHSGKTVYSFNYHKAAVKAIAWSPHQRGLLASGGGTADRTIRFWNTLNGTQVNEIETGSQVCNLAWSNNVNELVSTHGYSQNQIIIWRYPMLSKVVMLTGHLTRVLYLAVSPSGEQIVTGAGDETLRFWNVFPLLSSRGSSHENRSFLSPNRLSIR